MATVPLHLPGLRRSLLLGKQASAHVALDTLSKMPFSTHSHHDPGPSHTHHGCEAAKQRHARHVAKK